MPNGRIKFFDAEKGFGFIAGEDGQEVYVHVSALPAGTPAPKPGTRVEYSVADGRRGPQALAVTFPDPPPSVMRNQRRPPEDMVPIVEDLIRELDKASGRLRHGHYPENGRRIAKLLRVVADNFEA
ncbi:MAG TPA: cold shock domain-containing protein [Actinomycetaceae bacterium]|nr:cold shock domain-containing protein [Actinomycetaceae bacterium]